MDFKTAYRRLEIIYNECSPESLKRKAEEAKLDDFGKLRKKIHRAVKEIRQLIKDRDAAFSGKNANAKEAAEFSYKIRGKIKTVREEANSINEYLKEEEKKLGKAKAANDPKVKELESQVAQRKEIVDLVYKHLEECENLEKKRYTEKMSSADKAALFATSNAASQPGYRPAASADKEKGGMSPEKSELLGKYANEAPLESKGGQGGGGFSAGLPDIDIDEELVQINERNAVIDRDLEEISAGVGNLKEIAYNMGRELDQQNEVLENIDKKVDNAQVKLDNLNVQMKNNIERVMKGDKFLTYCILLVVLLAIGAAIASQVQGAK